VFVDQHDCEAIVIFDDFEQGAHPELRRPSHSCWQINVEIALPPEILL
jgi:hypothetical protein